jgi:hypothetical protein
VTNHLDQKKYSDEMGLEDTRQRPRLKPSPAPIRCFTGFSRQSTEANAYSNVGRLPHGSGILIATASYMQRVPRNKMNGG